MNGRVQLQIRHNAPEEGYVSITAAIWVDVFTYTVAEGTARSQNKALAFALNNLADIIKNVPDKGGIDGYL